MPPGCRAPQSTETLPQCPLPSHSASRSDGKSPPASTARPALRAPPPSPTYERLYAKRISLPPVKENSRVKIQEDSVVCRQTRLWIAIDPLVPAGGELELRCGLANGGDRNGRCNEHDVTSRPRCGEGPFDAVAASSSSAGPKAARDARRGRGLIHRRTGGAREPAAGAPVRPWAPPRARSAARDSVRGALDVTKKLELCMYRLDFNRVLKMNPRNCRRHPLNVGSLRTEDGRENSRKQFHAAIFVLRYSPTCASLRGIKDALALTLCSVPCTAS
jgi:hypothetical protein